jgi:hypothetical protein
MFTNATPDHLSSQLPVDAYYHLVRTLCLALPPPPSDNPEHLLQRNHAAIAGVAALCPVNAAEASLAADFVAASEQGRDCLRLAQLPETTPDIALKCRAQALRMMREAKSALRLLLKLQEARGKREADNAGCDRAAWSEHCAIALMEEALAAAPAAAQPRPAMAEPPAPALPSQPEPASAAARRAAIDLAPDLIAAAERYAAAYPDRAAAIRRTGKLLHDVRYFDPPEATLAGALIAGRTPALAALDREFVE